MSDNISGSKDDLINAISQMDTSIDNTDTTATTGADATTDTTVSSGNSADQTTAGVDSEVQEEDNLDEYLARFDKIESQNKNLQQLARSLTMCQHDQARVEVLCSYVAGLQNQLDTVYAQLVDMNNILGK